jgi:hypothetical protein
VATSNIQIILQSILTATNNLVSPAPYIANFDFQNPTMNAATFFYDPYFQAQGGGASVALPAAKVFLVAVQNLSTLAGLTVTVTPFGGAPSGILLGPGGVYIYFDPTESGQGVSAVTLTGTGNAFVMAGV